MNQNYLAKLYAIGTYPESGSNGPLIKDRFEHIFKLIDFNSLKTVMEVGSWDALDSIEMARLLPNAQFHIFEAAAENIPICHSNINRTDVKDRIKVWNMAANNTTGVMEFNAVDLENSKTKYNRGVGSKYKLIPGLEGSFINEHWAQKTVSVWGYRLDDWRKQYNIPPIDAIWMDVQGAELDVLKGAEQSLSDVKVIMTEAGIKPYYDGHNLKPDIDKFLSSNGFIEIESACQMPFEYEVNVIYVNTKFIKK